MLEMQVGKKLEGNQEEGIWLDYDSSCWFIFIKDSIWEKEELKRLFHGNVKIQFFKKEHVDGFLLDIFDCLETSDIPFCVKELNEESLRNCKETNRYQVKIVAVDMDNTILGFRDCTLSNENSKIIQRTLESRTNEAFTISDFEKDYEEICTKYEPYELEPFALFEETFK